MAVPMSHIKMSRMGVPVLIFALALTGCGGGDGSKDTQQQHSGTPLSITTTSLPGGQVNRAYSATLVATGGTAPLSWTISSGALPAGLTLASSGAISGTPTAATAASPVTFTVS